LDILRITFWQEMEWKITGAQGVAGFVKSDSVKYGYQNATITKRESLGAQGIAGASLITGCSVDTTMLPTQFFCDFPSRFRGFW
jgi:hypothetical protein